MEIPVAKDVIDAYRVGWHSLAPHPFPAGHKPVVGDRVTFREGKYGPHGMPSFVASGGSLTVTLSRVHLCGCDKFDNPIYVIEWTL
jgi:hypothetical protein